MVGTSTTMVADQTDKSGRRTTGGGTVTPMVAGQPGKVGALTPRVADGADGGNR